MKPVILSRDIDAPPAVVFAAISEPGGFSKHCTAVTAVEVLTEGPVRVGTRFRETRVMMGKPHSEVFEVTDIDPPRSFSLRCDSCGVRWTSRFTVEPAGRGSKLSMTMDGACLTFAAKLMTPLFLVMRGSMVKMIAKDFDDVKASVEREARG